MNEETGICMTSMSRVMAQFLPRRLSGVDSRNPV